MRVCIPIEFKKQGGGFYVVRALAEYLEARGHTVVDDVHNRYDILFTNSWQVHYDDVLEAVRRNPRVRIVHRVDGSSQDYGRDARGDEQQRRVNHFADATIFQSAYCRHSTREKFPVIAHDGPVIHNPVDSDLFSPNGPTADLLGEVRLAHVAFSTNPMKGSGDVYEVARRNPDVDFIMIGRYEEPPDLPNLHFSDLLARDELARVLRSCHAYVAFMRNEACPNVVLEALASGLPVLYLESGATSELVGECGLPVTIETFREQLDGMMARHSELSACARQRTESRFRPDVVFPRYIEVMQKALTKPLGWQGVQRWVWAWAVKLGRPPRDRLRHLLAAIRGQ